MQAVVKEQNQHQLSNTFNALADPTRLKIINLLLEDDNKCVSQLAADLGVSVSAVSQSCRILELNHLLRRQRQGQKICYQVRLDDPFVKQVIKFVTTHERKHNG